MAPSASLADLLVPSRAVKPAKQRVLIEFPAAALRRADRGRARRGRQPQRVYPHCGRTAAGGDLPRRNSSANWPKPASRTPQRNLEILKEFEHVDREAWGRSRDGAPVRGQIVEVDLDPVVGHEQGRSRPCVVVQNDVSNRFRLHDRLWSPYRCQEHSHICPPIYVLAPKGDGGLKKDSLVLCDQIRTVDQQRFGRFFGVLSPETMTAVDRALLISLGLARGGKA